MEFEVSPEHGELDILPATDCPRGRFRLFVQCGDTYTLEYDGQIGNLADILMSNALVVKTIGSGLNAFYVVHPRDLNYPDLVK